MVTLYTHSLEQDEDSFTETRVVDLPAAFCSLSFLTQYKPEGSTMYNLGPVLSIVATIVLLPKGRTLDYQV